MHTLFRNKIAPWLRYSLTTIVLLMLSQGAWANHVLGLDLFYTWVTGNTYKISLIVYADCGAGGPGTAFADLPYCTPLICIYNGNTSVSSINLAVEAPATGVEITPVCPSEVSMTQCTSLSYTTPGIKKFVYSGSYTVPYTSSVWRFIFGGLLGSSSYAGRALTVTNIATGTVSHLVDTLNNTTGKNSSPNLTVIPTPYFCLSAANNYNPGAVDPDGDSLSFALVAGRGTAVSSDCSDVSAAPAVTYISPYTATSPLAASSFSFDSHTGQISFVPNAIQRSLVVYNIEEFRSGTKVGTCQREMNFLVLTCTNTPASAGLSDATNGAIDDSIHFHVCQNTGPFQISLYPTEPVTTNNITVTASGLPTGCTVTTAGNGTPTPHTTISWTSTGVTPGSYSIYITFTDDNCPLVGTRTLAYTITILPAPNITYAITSPATCTQKATVSFTPTGVGSPWKLDVSIAPADTIQVFSGVTGATADSLASGTYTLTVYSTGVGTCAISIPVTIAYPPTFVITASSASPVYCGTNTGSITVSSLVPGSLDTVWYTYNGVLQPAIVATANAAGNIVITGLYSGTYSALYVVYGNCISIPLSAIILSDPPVPTPTATLVPPSYCGHHDGSLTLHGLHPGYTDTVRFTYNGTAQPYQLHTVAADSTIVITGLSSGVYTNITIAYGNCVSSPIGPYTLTDPAPLPTSATYVNPSYCGHNDGSITISGLHPGDADTISFYYNGVLQPTRALTVSASGTVVLTGLVSGVYSNITALFGPCATTAIGPYTLTDPPLLLPTVSFTNPSYCGHHDGTISITNLHPGDVDTIRYYYNGVLQTPLSVTVPASGVVTLTGLYAGVYSGITASYGPCTTTAVGPVTLAAPPLLVTAATFVSPTYCGSTDGSITITNLHPGDADTVKYYLNGVLQVKYVTVSATGSAMVTGLGAGVYTNIYVQFGTCITDTLGPFTLTDPPFTMRGLSFTNPTKCGFCDGTMTFYGLHPGQTDSVHFRLNGVLQPAVISTVLPDSTIVLSNLCEGAYSDIYVNFNANCVSGTYGPDTLVAPPIIPGFTYMLIKNCDGDTLICANTSTPAADLTYTWDFGDGTTSTVTNPIHVYTNPGVYHVVLHITNTRCVDSTSVNLTLNNLVVAGFHNLPDSFACVGTPVVFTNTSAGYGLIYNWNFGDGATDSGTNVTHTYSTSGIYHVVLAVSNAVPCSDTAKTVMEIDPLGDISMTVTDSVMCLGQHVTFTGIYPPYGNTGVVWTFGDGDSVSNVNPVVHAYNTTGAMTATVVAQYRACPDASATQHIWVFGQPAVDLGPDTSICPGSNALTLSDNINAANPAAHWQWSTGQTTSSIGVAEPGTYSVTVNIHGCEASDEVVVNNDCYINIPNVFSPNGDGINDYFMPRDFISQGLSSFKMEIFNRWGNLIFATTNTSGRGWDGNFNDTPQPQDVYVYIIHATFIDGHEENHKGNLTLIR